MADTILFDLTRLFYRLRRPNCSGIDRVLLEHAQHFHARDEVMFCVWSERGLRRVPRWLSNLLLDHLRHKWLSGRRRKRSRATVPLRWLGTRPRTVRTALAKACPLLKLSADSGARWTYLNAAHQHIDRVAEVKALAAPGTMRTVVMLHDIMPITHPHFHTEELQREFDRAVAQISATADLVLTNSEATSAEIRDYCIERKMRVPDLKHVALGGPPRTDARPTLQPETPIFVCLGTLSDRKNISLLDSLWAQLASTSDSPPELHLVGSPANGYDIPPRLLNSPHVVWHSSLREAELRDLLDRATALLAPSRAEGFGLPVVEALAQWVPVIASDLPAHREVGRDVIEFLPLDDIDAWQRAVNAYSLPQSEARLAQLDRMEQTPLPHWPGHCEEVLQNVINLQSNR